MIAMINNTQAQLEMRSDVQNPELPLLRRKITDNITEQRRRINYLGQFFYAPIRWRQTIQYHLATWLAYYIEFLTLFRHRMCANFPPKTLV